MRKYVTLCLIRGSRWQYKVLSYIFQNGYYLMLDLVQKRENEMIRDVAEIVSGICHTLETLQSIKITVNTL